MTFFLLKNRFQRAGLVIEGLRVLFDLCEHDWIATQKSIKGHTNKDETVKCAIMRIIPSLKVLAPIDDCNFCIFFRNNSDIFFREKEVTCIH